jgi:predicted transcriptional regulator
MFQNMCIAVTMLLSTLLSTIVAEAGVDQKASAFVLCKNQKSVRTIRVTPDQQVKDSCSITYTKGGVEELVGSNRSMTACKSILQKIRSNLETSRWDCRNVSSATVTSSSEVSR